MLTAVRRTFVTPFDRTDIQDLISSMDDLIDQMNKTAKTIAMFEVKTFEPPMQEMAAIIVQAAKLVVEAVPLLSAIGSNAGRLNALTGRIIAVEEQADEVHDRGLGAQSSSLFRSTGGNGAPGGNGGIVTVLLGQPGAGYQLATTCGADSDALLGLSVGGGGGYGGDVSGGSIGFGATLGGHGANGGDGGQVIVDNGYWYLPMDGSAPYLIPGYVISTTGEDFARYRRRERGRRRRPRRQRLQRDRGLRVPGDRRRRRPGWRRRPRHGAKPGHHPDLRRAFGRHRRDERRRRRRRRRRRHVDRRRTCSSPPRPPWAAVAAPAASAARCQAYNLDQMLTFGGRRLWHPRAEHRRRWRRRRRVGRAGAAKRCVRRDSLDQPQRGSLGGSGGDGGAGATGGGAELRAARHLGQWRGRSAGAERRRRRRHRWRFLGAANRLQRGLHQCRGAIGGNGGKGGDADAVTAYNSGLLYTLGAMAPGVKAQSIGGGGGNGGYGVVNSGSYNAASGPSVTATVAVGGSGGAGGDGGNVTVYNYVTPTLVPAYSIGAPGASAPNIYGGGAHPDLGRRIRRHRRAVGRRWRRQRRPRDGGWQRRQHHGEYRGRRHRRRGRQRRRGTGGQRHRRDPDQGRQRATASSPRALAAAAARAATRQPGRAPTPIAALENYVGNNLAQALGIDPSQAVVNVTTDIWDWKDNVVGAYNTLQRLQQIANGYDAATLPLVAPPASQTSTAT